MAGLRDAVRTPAVAGVFYPADPAVCREQARRLVRVSSAEELTHAIGGIVPHAGWVCSGALAGETLGALASGPAVELVVVFGAIHTPIWTGEAVLDSYGRWSLPGEASAVDAALRARLSESEQFRIDDRFHQREHAVEVEVPLIQAAWPGAALLPIEVPTTPEAPRIGRAVARAVSDAGRRAVFLASSDLTHYGPDYDFAPAGVGIEALRWAKENDRRLLEVVTDLRVDEVVPEVRRHRNACGGGAIAAMLAACVELGATRARVLRHANSHETLREVRPQQPDNAVGYAAVVVG